MSWFPEALELLASYDAGHRFGEILNDNLVQPILDHHQVGSGNVDEAYLDFSNHHFHPLPPFDPHHDHNDYYDGHNHDYTDYYDYNHQS